MLLPLPGLFFFHGQADPGLRLLVGGEVGEGYRPGDRVGGSPRFDFLRPPVL
jgi:hypothetical protein